MWNDLDTETAEEVASSLGETEEEEGSGSRNGGVDTVLDGAEDGNEDSCEEDENL